MKIAVYTIVKNEEKHIKRWADSAKDADVRMIVDTGSTDGTIEAAKEAGVDVYSIHVNPWRFDDARNAALALVPHDVDYCISLDADEVLLPDWRESLEACVEKGITRPRYKYVWSHDGDKEGIVFGGERIHPRHGYRWKHPVHEVLVTDNEERVGWCDLEIDHLPDFEKSRESYLPLLELAALESPEDDRIAHYLGREYMFHGRWEEAARQLKRHLELDSARWAPERAASMRFLSRCPNEPTEVWLLRACAESPDRRETWVELAEYYYRNQMWLLCVAAVSRALSVEEPGMDYICEPSAWGSLPYDIAAVAYYNLGMPEEALSFGELAIALSPGDVRLEENLNYYRAAVDQKSTLVNSMTGDCRASVSLGSGASL